MYEKRDLMKLALHIPVAIAPGAAARYPCRLTHRAVVQEPSECLWIDGVDVEADLGRSTSLLVARIRSASLVLKWCWIAAFVTPTSSATAARDAPVSLDAGRVAARSPL